MSRIMKSLVAHGSLGASALFLMAAPAKAQEWPRRPIHFNDRAECRTNPNDPFEPGATAIGGLDAGNCLDTALFRPLVTLFADEAQGYGLSASGSRVVVANVRDAERWMVAEIPLHAIDRETLLIEHFMPGFVEPGHSAFRVHFTEPVKLRPQLGDGRGYETNELVLSTTASGMMGSRDPVVFTKVVDDSYGLAMGIITMRFVVSEWVAKAGLKVEQWKLSIPPAIARTHAEKYIKRSNSYGFSRAYHLTARNCLTEHMSIFDDTLTYTSEQRAAMAAEGVLSHFVPIRSPAAFQARGLMPAANARLPDLKDDPAATALLREFGVR